MTKKAVPSSENPEEKLLDNSLRPQTFDEYIGQEKLKENLRILLSAAKKRKEPLEHILFYGPPGLGKTTLAHIIAHEMAANIRVTSGPALERAGDLASVLTNLEPGDILFIDEIHRLNKVVEEILYPAMEDYCLDIIIGKGPSARTLRVDLPKFTIIGATTRTGLLSSPLRDRFGVIYRLDFYDEKALYQIVRRSAKILNIEIDEESSWEIARRARGTPRVANRILRRVRDFCQIKGEGKAEIDICREALLMLGVDFKGLDEADRRLLLAIIEKHDGGPVGVETLAATISEDIGTIEEVLEPFLLQGGFLKRTSRGRIATKLSFTHLGIALPKNYQEQLL